jgi:nuclear transport factor 2 (NTF2) superfamily protein
MGRVFSREKDQLCRQREEVVAHTWQRWQRRQSHRLHKETVNTQK